MFDKQGLYFDVFGDDGTLFIKISTELIVHVLDLRKRLTVGDLTEDFVRKLIKMMFEGSPADKNLGWDRHRVQNRRRKRGSFRRSPEAGRVPTSGRGPRQTADPYTPWLRKLV